MVWPSAVTSIPGRPQASNTTRALTEHVPSSTQPPVAIQQNNRTAKAETTSQTWENESTDTNFRKRGAPHRKRCQQTEHKKFDTLLDLCVSSLRRGHANLLCIVPILSDDPRRISDHIGAPPLAALFVAFSQLPQKRKHKTHTHTQVIMANFAAI